VTWARFDDKFHAHPKALKAGLPGCGLFLRAVTYCCDHLTDGFVPEEWVATQLGPNDGGVPDRMIDAGLWTEAPGGFDIADFLDFNPSRKVVERRRKARSKAGKAGARGRWNPASPEGSMASAIPVAIGVAPQLHDHVNAPNRSGTGTGEEQQRLQQRIENVRAIFARFDFELDDASIENALERGRGVDGLDHEDLARSCAEWCQTNQRPPAPTFHSFISNKLKDLAETREREQDKATPDAMVPMRTTCREKGCANTPQVGDAYCRPCRNAILSRLTGDEAA
jgi:hypothetical protein